MGNEQKPCRQAQGGLVDGVKVKKPEERDSVPSSVGGARTDPNPELVAPRPGMDGIGI
jgi:hypothetical protein